MGPRVVARPGDHQRPLAIVVRVQHPGGVPRVHLAVQEEDVGGIVVPAAVEGVGGRHVGRDRGPVDAKGLVGEREGEKKVRASASALGRPTQTKPKEEISRPLSFSVCSSPPRRSPGSSPRC